MPLWSLFRSQGGSYMIRKFHKMVFVGRRKCERYQNFLDRLRRPVTQLRAAIDNLLSHCGVHKFKFYLIVVWSGQDDGQWCDKWRGKVVVQLVILCIP